MNSIKRVKIALLQTAKDLAKQDSIVLAFEDLINQRSSNYYVVNTNNHIHGPTLEYYLHKALTDHQLILDFEFGVYDCTSNKMVYGNYCEIGTEADELTTTLGDLPKMEGLTSLFWRTFSNENELYARANVSFCIFYFTLIIIHFLFWLCYCPSFCAKSGCQKCKRILLII